MTDKFKILLTSCTLIFTTLCLAQDTSVDDLDNNYREDQFYVGLTYNLITNVPTDVKVRGFSGGFRFGFIRDMPVNERRNVAVGVGLGMAFNRYGQNLSINRNNNDDVVYLVLNEAVDFDANSFSAASIEAPIEIRFRNSTAASYRFWRVYAGFKLGYVYYHRAILKQGGNTYRETNIPEFEKVRLGLTLSFGYNTFNFYGYYSLNPFFKDALTTDGQEVDFSTIRVGLIFYIL